MAQFVYNSARNETTGRIPFLANCGYNAEIWRDPQTHRSRSQKALIDTTEMRRVHAKLTEKDSSANG